MTTINQSELTNILKLAAGLFNAAPGKEYLNEFTEAYIANGRNLEALADSMGQTDAFKSVYPSFLTVEAFTSQFLTTLGLEDNEEAQAFVATKVAAGESFASVIYQSLVALVESTSDEFAAARDQLSNKATVAEHFSVTLGRSSDDLAVLQGAIAGVTDDPATVEAAEKANEGQTFTLTTGADTGPDFTGTDADDTFDATLGRAGELPVTEQKLQGIDSLDGGAGRDTLNAHLNGFSGLFDAQNPEIVNIEQYNLTVSADSAAGGLDLARASGYDTLQNIDSRGDLYLGNVNVSEDGKAPTIALTNVRGDTEVTYDDEVDSVSVQNVTASTVGLHDDDANLRIDVDNGRIETLNLDVSNGVYLDLEGDADRIQNLNISGSGILELEGNSDFGYLETLDSTKYTGDLDLDVSGSEVLESAETGAGDDRVVINHNAVTYDALTEVGLHVDMGLGENVLALAHVDDETDINPMNFGGGVANVQTLEFIADIDLNADAHLNLTGFDENLSTLLFDDDFDGDGHDLQITAGLNGDVNIVSLGDDFEDVSLTTVGVKNLTIDVSHIDSDGDHIGKLEILDLGGVGLETFHASAADDAEVTISSAGAGDLKSVSVTSTGGYWGEDATLEMNGTPGIVPVVGVQQEQVFDIQVTSASIGGGQYRSAGHVTLASTGLPGGAVTVNYVTTTNLIGSGSQNHTTGAVNDIVAALNALNAGFTAVAAGGILFKDEIVITWDDPGVRDPITINAAGTSATTGTLPNFAEDMGDRVNGVDVVTMEPGEGFESLTDVLVVALDEADGDVTIELTDVYGGVDGFTVEAQAGDYAWVDLDNTGATAVTVTAGDYAEVNVWGNTYGNQDLEIITIDSNRAEINLYDNVASLRTLDVSKVATYVEIDASAAEFHWGLGEAVTYLIGDTGDGAAGTDVWIMSNVAAAEVFSFVADGFQEVLIDDFTAGSAGNHDVLDLSEFGISSSDLTINMSFLGDSAVITAAGVQGFGEITLTGMSIGTDANDLINSNIDFG